MNQTVEGVRVTVFLAAPAAAVLERARATYDGYGLRLNVSAVVTRLMLGETIDEVIGRPFRAELVGIESGVEQLREELRRARARRQTADLRRIHDAVAALYPEIKKVGTALGQAKRRAAGQSPDVTEAARIEKRIDELMAECADAIAGGRRR